MPENVIASVQLGWFVAGAALLLLAGVGVGWQVSARQQARRAGHTRQALQARLAALLNALPQAALLADAGGALLAWNPRAAGILDEFHLSRALPEAAAQAVARSARYQTVERVEFSPPGVTEKRYQALVTPITGDQNQPQVLIILSDLSTENSRTILSQRLTGTLAHELRTPLTAILGHVEILASCGIEEEDLWRRSLGFVSSEADRLARLVEDLLQMARLERSPLYLQPVDLHRLAEETLAALHNFAGKNRMVFSLQAPPDLPCALADADRLRQVFTNLIDNTIKYAPGSTVTIQFSTDASLVHVRIHDDGPGIEPGELAHVFEPFYRSGRSAGRARGAGLGLTIVQTILDQHRASIQAHSRPGEGVSFSFSLPAANREN